MGPTRFLPDTHNLRSHRDFEAAEEADASEDAGSQSGSVGLRNMRSKGQQGRPTYLRHAESLNAVLGCGDASL